MGVWKYVMKSITVGGKHGGNYNVSTGVVTHPPKGSGKKSPKVVAKQVKQKGSGK